jgi:hypothetical protein
MRWKEKEGKLWINSVPSSRFLHQLINPTHTKPNRTKSQILLLLIIPPVLKAPTRPLPVQILHLFSPS